MTDGCSEMLEEEWAIAEMNLSANKKQVGGTHYTDMKIQPFEYIYQNGIGFAEGCAIKYLSRWRNKGGIQDLHKAKHFIEMLIEAEVGK